MCLAAGVNQGVTNQRWDRAPVFLGELENSSIDVITTANITTITDE
jgi:hypothetical protein